MLNIVEIGAEVKIKNACLVSHNRFSHTVDRLMCCPIRPVSVRSRLKVSFEYRLQDELERSLDYTVADAGNRKDADFCAPVFRYLPLPCRHGLADVRRAGRAAGAGARAGYSAVPGACAAARGAQAGDYAAGQQPGQVIAAGGSALTRC